MMLENIYPFTWENCSDIQWQVKDFSEGGRGGGGAEVTYSQSGANLLFCKFFAENE